MTFTILTANTSYCTDEEGVQVADSARPFLEEWMQEKGYAGPLEPPAEPGLVRYRVEVVPHDWANDGQTWEIGTLSPADVARALRAIADQVEYFTAPRPTLAVVAPTERRDV